MSTSELRDFVEDHDRNRPRPNYLALQSTTLPSLETPRQPRLASEASYRNEDYGYALQLDDRLDTSTQATLNGIGLGSGHSPDVSLPAVAAEDLESLADRIRGAMKYIPGVLDGTKCFLPFGDLQRLCDYPKVLQELQYCFRGREDEPKYLADYVCGIDQGRIFKDRSARKIFATLVLIGKPNYISKFFRARLCDKDLPFSRPNTQQSGDGVLQPRLRDDIELPQNREACFESYEKNSMILFHREQFQFLAPFVAKSKKDEVIEYQLHAATIMPYIQYEVISKDSAFSWVYKVKIHPDHHSFAQYDTFALKVLLPCTEEAFEQELYAMRKMKPGPHVLPLCATFKCADELSFLFPWAEGGNLNSIWEHSPSNFVSKRGCRNPSQDLIRWIAEQCAGLAEGLKGIHNATPAMQHGTRLRIDEARFANDYGIHGDLKPDNIFLFFEDKSETEGDLGVLKLADFGLTRFHTAASRSLQPGKGPICPTYASPEHATLIDGVSRKSDIWALGCVFTQFLTWAIRGSEAHKDLRNACYEEKDIGRSRKSLWMEDKFFKTVHQDTNNGNTVEPFLKEAVVKCLQENMDAMPSTAGTPNFLQDFLKYIRDHMLVIETSDRATSKELCIFLQKAKNSTDDAYWAMRIPVIP